MNRSEMRSTFSAVFLCICLSLLFPTLGAIQVSVSSVSVTVGINETLSQQFTVTNNGASTLRFRIRDLGSPFGLRQDQPPVILTSYPWTLTPLAIEFDGIYVWYTGADGTSFVRRLLETGTQLTLQSSAVTWPLAYSVAWDGSALWTTNGPRVGDTSSRIGRFNPSTGAVITQLTPNPEGRGLGFHAWDGSRLWITYFQSPITVTPSSGNTITSRPGISQISFIRGASAYADQLGGFGFTVNGSIDWRRLTLVNTTNGQFTNFVGYPFISNSASVDGAAFDGFGRMIVAIKDGAPAYLIHVDTGLRYWLSCPTQGVTAQQLAPGASATITLRFDSSKVTPGRSYSTEVWVDSDDATMRRVAIPITMSVSTQPAAAPSGSPLSFTTDRDVSLFVEAPGVLANVRGSAPLAALVETNPANGNIQLFSNGSFIYTPNSRYIGNDQFTFRARDPQLRVSSPIVVTINVRDVPHIAVTPRSQTVSLTTAETKSAIVQVTNTGLGTLKVYNLDVGTGGTASSPMTLISTLNSIKFRNDMIAAYDGQSFWCTQGLGTNILKIDALDGTLKDGGFDTGLTGSYIMAMTYGAGLIWVSDSTPFVRNETSGQFVPARPPRLLAFDTQGNLVKSVNLFPLPTVWIPAIAYDADSNCIWLTNFYSNTFRIDINTLNYTRFPAPSTQNLGNSAFYDGSLWMKDLGTIKRFNPRTGQLQGTYTWTFSNLPTSNNFYLAFAGAGSGRFWALNGAPGSITLVLLDTGMRGWLTYSPFSLEVPAGQTRSVQVSIKGTAMSPGSYSTKLYIFTNDVDRLEEMVTINASVVLSPPLGVPPQAPPSAASAPIRPPAKPPVASAPTASSAPVRPPVTPPTSSAPAPVRAPATPPATTPSSSSSPPQGSTVPATAPQSAGGPAPVGGNTPAPTSSTAPSSTQTTVPSRAPSASNSPLSAPGASNVVNGVSGRTVDLKLVFAASVFVIVIYMF